MINNIYKSILKDRIFNFINFKQEQGYKYIIESYVIKDFDKFLLKINYNKGILSREIVDRYTISLKNEGGSLKKNRFSLLKEFSIYLKMFEAESYQINKNIFKVPAIKKSYIFSEKEIVLLLKSFQYSKRNNDLKSITNYTILGLLAFTGLRIQECLNLNIEQWDSKKQLLFIKNGKFGKDRLIPIDKSVNDKLKSFNRVRQKYKSIDKDEPLFINNKMKRVNYATFRIFFNKKLKEKCINNYGANSRKPTIHSLRHSFAVKILLNWVKAGNDTNYILPYLSTYMGHISLESTQIYLQSIKELNEIEYKKFYQIFKKNV